MQGINSGFLGFHFGILARPSIGIVILLAFKIRGRNAFGYLVLDLCFIVVTRFDERSQLLPTAELQVFAPVDLKAMVHPLLSLSYVFLVLHIGRYKLQRAGKSVRTISDGCSPVQIGPSQEGMFLSVLPIQTGGLGIVAVAIEQVPVRFIKRRERVPPIQGITDTALYL